MAHGYKTVSTRELNTIIDRLSMPTVASRAWEHDYNAQETHVKLLRESDPDFQPKRTASPDQLDKIVNRITKATLASTAAYYNFDHEDANLAYLKSRDEAIQIPLRSASGAHSEKNMPSSASTSASHHSRNDRISVNDTKRLRGRSRSKSPRRSPKKSQAYGYRSVSNHELNGIVDRLNTPTTASQSWSHDYNAQESHVQHLRRNDPDFQPRRTATLRRLDAIIERLTRPTVVSIAHRWNFDSEDANLAHLKTRDPNIHLPLRTPSRGSIPGSQDKTSRREYDDIY